MEDSVKADEFECDTCHRLIYSLPPHTVRGTPPPTRCACCTWLDEFVADPVEREQLRKIITT